MGDEFHFNTLPTITTMNKTQALFRAIRKSDVDTVEELLDTHPKLIHAENKEGQLPLSYAVELDNPGIVCCLLEHGANVNDKDSCGPLINSAKSRDVVNILLGFGAKRDEYDIHLWDSESEDLGKGVLSNDPPDFCSLKELKEDEEGWIAEKTEEIVEAIKKNNFGTLEENDLNYLLGVRDSEGNTLLHYAVIYNRPRMLQFFLHLCPNANIPNSRGRTAKELAMILEDTATIKILKSY